MYDLNFKIHGLDYPVRYTYKDCIFVFEDVRAKHRYGCAITVHFLLSPVGEAFVVEDDRYMYCCPELAAEYLCVSLLGRWTRLRTSCRGGKCCDAQCHPHEKYYRHESIINSQLVVASYVILQGS